MQGEWYKTGCSLISLINSWVIPKRQAFILTTWCWQTIENMCNNMSRLSLLSFCGQHGRTHLSMCVCGRILLINVTSEKFSSSLTNVHRKSQQYNNTPTPFFDKFLCWQSVTVQMSRSTGSHSKTANKNKRNCFAERNKRKCFPNGWGTRLLQFRFSRASKNFGFSNEQDNTGIARYFLNQSRVILTLPRG